MQLHHQHEVYGDCQGSGPRKKTLEKDALHSKEQIAHHNDALVQAQCAEQSFTIEKAVGRKLIDSNEHGKRPIEDDVRYLQSKSSLFAES